MEHFLTPSYTHEKLENPSFSDLLDVFEDSWSYYVFTQVRYLMKSAHGEVAAVTILCSYYEAIQSYITGLSSKNKSQEFFVKGFMHVFHSESFEIERAAQEIYRHIRCGLAHEGMLRHKVNYYSQAGTKAFVLTYPKKPDGDLDISTGAESIIINPTRIYEGTMHHFTNYVGKLRTGDNSELCRAFQKTVERQWSVGSGENIVGMTEAEFLGSS